MNSTVVIAKVNKNDYVSALKKSFDILELDVSNLKGEKIVIKPGLCNIEKPELGNTTDVRLVEALVKVLKEHDVQNISIVESDHWVASADEEFEKLGYTSLEKYRVKLVNLSKEQSYNFAIKGKYLNSVDVPKTMFQCTFFISVPKLKVHYFVGISCAIKNLFGLLRTRYKFKYHPFLKEVLFDLNSIYKPNLIVVDADYVSTVNSVQRLGLILVGTDSVAVDYVASKVLNISLIKFPLIRYFLTKLKIKSKMRIIDVTDGLTKMTPQCYLPFSIVSSYSVGFFFERLGFKIENQFNKCSELIRLFTAKSNVEYMKMTTHPKLLVYLLKRKVQRTMKDT